MSDWPVLLVATGKASQDRVARLLREEGYEPFLATSSADAALARTRFAFTVVDTSDDGLGDPAWLQPPRADRNALGPLIALADDGRIAPQVDVTALGADWIIWGDVTADTLGEAIRDVLSRHRQSASISSDSPTSTLQREIALWQSDRMQGVWQTIRQAASVDVTVLISGETGTGKDLAARAIHYLSSRKHARYVAVNCAAVPRDLLESELFGHERGAFTGAHQLQRGKFEAADRGTILLDEIGDLDLALQAKLLHVLQDGRFSRVGGTSAMKVDVRVLAATNRDLTFAVAAERFRDDLYYRLNVIHIVVPPLRERREEIPLLAAYFVERYSKLYRREGFQLVPETIDRLMRHRYPGNVRELENIIKRMIVLGDPHGSGTSFAGPRTPEHHSNGSEPSQLPAVFLKSIAREAAQRVEREEILKMLERTRWNRVQTAKLLNISYRSLLYKMKGAGLDRTPPTHGFSL